MKYFFYTILIIVVFGVNLALAHVFNIKLLLPSLVFLIMLCFATTRTSYEYFYIATFAGLLLDFYSRAVPGSFTVSFLIVVYSINSLLNWMAVLEIDWKFLLVATALSVVLVYLVVWAYSTAAVNMHWTELTYVFHPSIKQLITELCVDLLLVLPVYAFTDWLRAKIEMALSKQQVIR